jgi:hypothetical protein
MVHCIADILLLSDVWAGSALAGDFELGDWRWIDGAAVALAKATCSGSDKPSE